MAIGILSIPTMNDDRVTLSAKSIKKVECLKSWHNTSEIPAYIHTFQVFCPYADKVSSFYILEINRSNETGKFLCMNSSKLYIIIRNS
jgi:hypothetical protein